MVVSCIPRRCLTEEALKAILFTRYGPPTEVLRLQEVPKPKPADGEVLVKVHATAVNDWDWGYVRGRPGVLRLLFGLLKPKFSVMGAEVAGTVEALGAHASRFSPGDRVHGDLSAAGFGGFAENVCVREDALAAMPADMSYEQAAALPHAAMLALQGLVDVGAIRDGERVLINGAGGGVGTIGVQIAKEFGCEVTGVDADHKLDLLRSMGFDHVIDYTRQDFTSDGRHYDLILDTKTNRPPRRYLRSLVPGGRYVTVGGNLLRLLQIACLGPLISRISGKHLRVLALEPNKDLAYIHRMFEEGKLEIPLDGPYPLDQVPEAVERFGQAKHLGKVVIRVRDTHPELGTLELDSGTPTI